MTARTIDPVRFQDGRLERWIRCADCDGDGLAPIFTFGEFASRVRLCLSCGGSGGRWSLRMPDHPVDALVLYLAATGADPLPPAIEAAMRARCDQQLQILPIGRVMSPHLAAVARIDSWGAWCCRAWKKLATRIR